MAEREDAEPREALVEELEHALLQRAVEVDHHVAADDHVELVEAAVGDEVVLREDDVLDEAPVEERAVVAREVVLGERARAARREVVLRVLLHLLERKDAEPRALEHGLVDVRRVDPRAVEEPSSWSRIASE